MYQAIAAATISVVSVLLKPRAFVVVRSARTVLEG